MISELCKPILFMKKVILIVVLFSPIFSNGQIIAFKTSEVKPYPKKTESEFKQWYSLTPLATIMRFNQNTVGVKTSISKIKEILSNNDLDFDTPTKDESYLASYVDDIYDYENINLSCKAGGSIIAKTWEKGNERIVLSLDEKFYTIFHIKLNPK